MKSHILLLFLLVSNMLVAQSNNIIIDSLVSEEKKNKSTIEKTNLLIEISKQYRNLNPNEGIKYGNQALILAKKHKLSEQTILALVSISDNYYNLGDIEKSLQLVNQANSLARTNKEKTETLISLGKIYLSKADYKKALQIFYQSLAITENDKMDQGIMGSCYYLGVCYSYLMEPNKAIKYYKKSFMIAKKLKNDKRILSALHGIGGQYEYLMEFAKAEQYYVKALEMANKLNDPFSISTLSSSYGNLLFRMNKIEESLKMINISQEKAIQINNIRLSSANDFIKGRIYFLMAKKATGKQREKLLSKAELLLKNCITSENNNGNINVVSQSYELLSEIYSLQNDYKKAIEYYINHNKYQDSIYNEDTKQTIKSLEDERIIALKNKEIEINKLKLSNNKKQTWIFIVALAFLTIIGGLLFYQNLQRKKTNLKLQQLNTELDQANKIKTRFFSILNHDLRGPVANIIQFLHLQKENPEVLDETTQKRLQEKTLDNAENLLNSMEDLLLWSKGQMENFKPQLKSIAVQDLFEDTQKVFSGYSQIEFQYRNDEQIKLTTDENYLKTILRNLTSNAINVFTSTANPKIIWKATTSNGQPQLTITDNGPGASLEQFKALYDENEVVGIKSGLGLHLIRDLAKAIDCEISVNSVLGEGTTFTLTFHKKA